MCAWAREQVSLKSLLTGIACDFRGTWRQLAVAHVFSNIICASAVSYYSLCHRPLLTEIKPFSEDNSGPFQTANCNSRNPESGRSPHGRLRQAIQ
jgi:hypothetical protein